MPRKIKNALDGRGIIELMSDLFFTYLLTLLFKSTSINSEVNLNRKFA